MSTLFSFFHNYSYPASISLFFFFNDTATTEIYTYLTHSFPTRRSSDLRHIAVIDAAEFRTLAVIDADLVRGEGRFVGAARHRVHIGPEGRNSEAVDHVRAGDDLLHLAAAGADHAVVHGEVIGLDRRLGIVFAKLLRDSYADTLLGIY